MARFIKKRKKVIGKSPGSMIFIGDRKTEATQIRLIDYNRESISEKAIYDMKAEKLLNNTDSVSWINFDGLHDTDVIRDTGELFNLHPLLLDDIVNTGQRPKFAEYDNCIFMVLKMLRYNGEINKLVAEQFSIVSGDGFLLTFQEQPGDVFDPVRERLRKARGRIRGCGSDYLAYALLDTVVGNYIQAVGLIGDEIEQIEEDIMGEPDRATLEKIYLYKREMNYLRKTVRPARELILHLTHAESELISESTIPFLKDLLDLFTEATEAVEAYREMLSDFLNLYNTAVGNRMNDIMKVLTVFAAIFIPLTFIAGIYGTNFEYVPELTYRYSYFIFWAVIVIIALSMVLYFRRKKWF